MTDRNTEHARCTDPDTGKLIHHFEMGQLADADRVRFEEHLLRCDLCAAEVESMFPVAAAMRANRDAIRQGLADDGITFKNLQEQLLRNSRDKYSQSSSGKVAKRWKECRDALSDLSLKWKMLGAGGAFALSAAVVLLLVFSQPKIDQRYAPLLSFQAFPYEGSVRLRGEQSSSGQSDFESGMRAYNLGDYSHAIPQLKRAVAQSPNQGEWWLYLGISCYLNKEIRPALKSLRNADALVAGDHQETARWYLAQTFLLAGMRAEAVHLLDGLASRDTGYGAKAAQLRSSLNSIRP